MTIPKLVISKSVKPTDNVVINISKDKEIEQLKLSQAETDYVKACLKNDDKWVLINRFSQVLYLVFQNKSTVDAAGLEHYRKIGAKIFQSAKQLRLNKLAINIPVSALSFAFAEGLLLAGYQFLPYKSNKKKLQFQLSELSFTDQSMNKASLHKLEVIYKATCLAREWVNEPNSFLTSTTFAAQISEACTAVGCDVKVMDKKEITKLKMGGLLAVNKGSVEPPTFTSIEWKPKKAKNKKPIVLVGKGVVYDTGGLSLKPTAHSMDYMKSDMGGAAAVAGAMYEIAALNADVHVIGLIPSTDNRPGGNAYAPGDVVQMMNGLNVEVLNTDAEGRMILADALSYGDRFEPELVLNAATLTGSAARAIGTYGIVAMGNAGNDQMNKVKIAGDAVYERIVEFPFWTEYDEEIKSDIADLKNLGSDMGGAITAGKFLANFTKAPFIHLDIAGPAYLHKATDYKTTGGTGVGVRLFTEFLLNY